MFFKRKKRPVPELISPSAVLLIECPGKRLYASREDNPAAKAFFSLLGSEPLSVSLSREGALAVGALRKPLPADGACAAAKPGDLVLCGDGRLALCLEACGGPFTRLARIGSEKTDALLASLGGGETPVRFSLEWSE